MDVQPMWSTGPDPLTSQTQMDDMQSQYCALHFSAYCIAQQKWPLKVGQTSRYT